MESLGSFNAVKSGKAYIVAIENLAPGDRVMTFHVDSGASVTLIGLNSFCRPDKENDHDMLRNILLNEIKHGNFEPYRTSGFTITDEEIEMYPCKFDGVSISGTKPITLYFYIYLGDISMPLLGFDYIDDTSYNHSIGGDLAFTAIRDSPGRRFYPDRVIDFNSILDSFIKHR